MTKEQTRLALETMVRACYFGATRRSRLAWNLVMAGYDLHQTAVLIRTALDAHLLEDFQSYGWVGVTPFMISVLDNWDALTQDSIWTDDITEQEDTDDETDGDRDSQVF